MVNESKYLLHALAYDVVTAFLAILLIGTTCYLVLAGNEIPDALAGMDGAVITYFFMRQREKDVSNGV